MIRQGQIKWFYHKKDQDKLADIFSPEVQSWKLYCLRNIIVKVYMKSERKRAKSSK